MKTKNTLYAILISLPIALTHCTEKKQQEHVHDESTEQQTEAADSVAEPQHKVDLSFQRQLGDVFTAYVTLKDAFISSDADKVKAQAAATAASLQQVDMKLLTGAAHHDWMTYFSGIQGSLNEIQSAADIAAQRLAFSTLSDNVYKSIKAFGLGGKEAYYEFCPMAFDNRGAYWLSDQSKVLNPYFGDEMLTCGTVVEKLK